MASIALSDRWFRCQNGNCDRWITGLNREAGKHRGHHRFSSTHCCIECQKGLPHDEFWCGGTPGQYFRPVLLPCGEVKASKAHCVVFEPDWDEVETPVPAVLWLHGANTFSWPESLWLQVQPVVEANEQARKCVIIAPFATPGEPLTIVSDYRVKPDRFGRQSKYVEAFDVEQTWACFLSACHQIGPHRVDFERLCVTGFSMGAQAAWDLAMQHGSRLAAVCPIAGRCKWPSGTESWPVECVMEELRALPIRAYSVEEDEHSYSWRDFQWIASDVRDLPRRYSLDTVPIAPSADSREIPKEARLYSWGQDLQIGLIRPCHGHEFPANTDERHNCWDLVYSREDVFELFTWMSGNRNPHGGDLA